MDEPRTRGPEAARAFLEVLRSDDDMSRRLDQVVDDQILSVSRAIAAERGFDFTAEELHEAVIDNLSLVEFEFGSNDGGAGKCKSDSGCRTPCVYCKSNRDPTLGDLGDVVFERRQER